MVECKHCLMCFSINDWFALRGALAAHLEFGDELRFLIPTEIVAEKLRRLEFLADDPKRYFGDIEQFGVVIFLLQEDSNGLPFAKTMVARVGHHYQTFEHIKLMFQRLKGQADLPIDLSLVNQLFSFHGFFEHLIAELLTDEPPCSVLLLVDNLTNSSARRHLLQTIDHSQIFCCHVLIKVVKTTKFFRSHWTL